MITGTLWLIYGTSLLLGLAAGFIMHRSDYCVAGMFRDAFLFRRIDSLRFLLLQVVLTMLLFELARWAGLLSFYPFPILAPPSLVNLLGGALFGFGMVMAGGCIFGTLYKMGAGSLISMAAFLGLIVGSGVYTFLDPWWSELALTTKLSTDRITVPQALGLDPALLVLLISIPALSLFIRWRRQGLWRRSATVGSYLQPWKAAVLLAGIGMTSYLLIGMPMGITTTFAKLFALVAEGIAPEWVAEQAFFQKISLDVVHPFSGALLRGGPGPQLDILFAIQFPLLAGVVLGSACSALSLGEFALRLRVPVNQLLAALVGGVLMGLAARAAPSCNVWHLMGGLPILAMQSILFLLGVLPGAWLGSRVIKAVIVKSQQG